MSTRIQVRRDTSANWAAADPILAAGEFGLDLTTATLKVGDGVTAWSSLSALGGTVAQAINAQTGTTYTLVASDAGKLVTCSNGSAITVTLPQDSDATIPIGASVDVAGIGAGLITFAAGTGATVNGTPSLATRAQWSAVTCYKRAANTWLVVGDLA